MAAGKELALVYPWVSGKMFRLDLALSTDALTAFMLPLVHGIALLVQCYSIGYMKGDSNIARYFGFIQLFLFSMIGILLAGNLIIIYAFWELVGLCSYLLIGFWNRKPRTVWAAQKAFIMNRIGDAAFLSGILLLIYHTGTADFALLSRQVATIPPAGLTVIGLLLFGGCMGKSAQFPLSAWLPDAMEGPTPVSALIHAATMVAAGIYLMARVAFLLTPTAEMIIAGIGLITMADGAIRACFAWDIKRVLAYSTQSQLGLMVFAIGTGAWQLAMFHLVTHAFFKAGLFLSAGSVIHALTPGKGISFDRQDMRLMGGLRSKLPVTFACYLVCSAALAGLPFFSGFLSKDAIFISAAAKATAWGGFAYVALVIAMAAAGLTAYYMTRQVRLVFFGAPRYHTGDIHPHESGALMLAPTGILSLLSFFLFFSGNPVDAANGWFARHLELTAHAHGLFVPAASVVISILAIFIATRKVQTVPGLPELREDSDRNRFALLRDYREDRHFSTFFLAPFQWAAEVLKNLEIYVIDGFINLLGWAMVTTASAVNWIDRIIVDGVVKLVTTCARQIGQLVRSFQNGRIQTYYLVTFISLLLLVAWIMAGQ
ncbi:hypothetical protein GCM10023091_42840 [Ravibacter arvi]|uniref:NADH-quinone oxidoreductase subunit L n=2 Tax=Ravibacter arvi TaxID=2051041 RepID=A0ABP8MDG9_9BACT